MRSRRDVLRDAKIGIVELATAAFRLALRRILMAPATFITVSLAATGGLLVAMRTEALGAQMQMPAPTGRSASPPTTSRSIPTIAC